MLGKKKLFMGELLRSFHEIGIAYAKEDYIVEGWNKRQIVSHS